MRLLFAALLLLLAPITAQAEDLLVGGVGATDALSGDRSAPEVRLEYRPDWSLLPFIEPHAALKPWAGVELSTRGSVWGGGGVLLDIDVGPFALVPQIGLGAYGQGNGKNLGSVLEIRSGVELAYKSDNGARVALGFSHMSNVGITRHNPGTEALLLSYQIPLSRLLGY